MTYQEQPQSRVPMVTGDGVSVGGELSGLACPHLPRVSLYHDDELGADERRALSEHLATCRPCSEALAFFGRVSGAFSSAAGRPRLESDSRERLRSLFPTAELVVEPLAGRSRRPVPGHVRWVRRLTAVAAVLFIVAVFRIVYQHYPFTGQHGIPADYPQPPAPVFPDKSPAVTGDGHAVPSNGSDQSGPAGRSGAGPRRPAGDAPKAAPAMPSTPGRAPSTGPTIS